MAYDIILADIGTRIHHPRNGKRVLYLDESEHTAIFAQSHVNLDEFPYFASMGDYYLCGLFEQNEIKELLGELERLMPLFSNQPDTQHFLHELALTCKVALRENRVILCSAD